MFGSAAWTLYSALRTLMGMCITNNLSTYQLVLNYSLPSYEQQELQLADMETILEFETHLAAASTKMAITENNSPLLSQVLIALNCC